MNKRFFYISAAVGIFLVLIIIYSNFYILQWKKEMVTADAVAPHQMAVVFGGGMDKGQQSPMQEDRVREAVDLYKAHKVKMLMMTGDNGEDIDDEVDAMKAFAVEAGVPSSSILLDPHGYRTYESCYRERYVYGVTSTIVISQTFHLPRILYFCSSMGIESVGVPADLRGYGWGQVKADVREVLARVKGWWQMEVTKPLPQTLEK